MAARLIITIDTEADMPGWRPQRQVSLRNLEFLPKLQELFERYKVPPTYLITYPVTRVADSMRWLRDHHEREACEVGAHLHPWTTPPLEDSERLENLHPHRLPLVRQRDKLRSLTEAITQELGERPISYRAGRFGFDGSSLRLLEEEGYEIDTSVTPLKCWIEEDGPGFFHAPAAPYYPDADDVIRPGSSPILEVPVTAGMTTPLPRTLQRIYYRVPRFFHMRGILHRLSLLKLVGLRPWIWTAEEMIDISRRMVDRGQPVLNMMFHSSDVYPGANPNCPDEEASRRFFAKLEAYLEAVVGSGLARGATLRQFRDDFEARAPMESEASEPAITKHA